MIYNELIINESIWNILTSYISNQKMPHSMIFHGINGTGKEAHAIEFSALLNCENTQNKQACGACASCQQIKKMQNPQLKIITPLPRGKINSIKSASLNALTDKEIKELNEMKLKKGKNNFEPKLPAVPENFKIRDYLMVYDQQERRKKIGLALVIYNGMKNESNGSIFIMKKSEENIIKFELNKCRIIMTDLAKKINKFTMKRN